MRFADSNWAGCRSVAAMLAAICLTATATVTSASGARPKHPLVGAVTFVSGSGVKVAGKNVGPGGESRLNAKSILRPLYAGDAVRTTEHGWVQFNVRIGERQAYCKTDPTDGWVVVNPKPSVFIDFRAGITYCGTEPTGGQKPMTARGQVKLDMEDPVFKVVVRGGRRVVSVHKGAIVVSGNDGSQSAVVLGRAQETTVRGEAKPSRPTKTTPTKGEKRTFAKLDQALPPVTDNTAPKPTVTGPRDPSSLRRATFTFSTPGADATFSCALDGDDFRLCRSPQETPRLAPGRHTFAVKATDAAGNTGVTAYSWTIDASRITFMSRREGGLQVFVMDPDAEGVRRLTGDGANWDPAWSPDAKRIAFHSTRDGNEEIYVMNADGTGQTRLTANGGNDRNPTWSPDGSKIAFESDRDGNREIYVMNASGSGVTRLTSDAAEDIDPAWSPDGRRIAFASMRDAARFQIYVMNPDGSGVTRLVTSTGKDFNPAWSPDGSKIAFHSDRDGISSKIYLMNPDGTEQKPLTTTASVDFNPVFAPDGQELVFQRLRPDGRAQLYMVNVDGGGTLRLTDGEGDDLVPDW